MEARQPPLWLRIFLNLCGPAGLGVTLMGWVRPVWGIGVMAIGLIYVVWETAPWTTKQIHRRPLVSLAVFMIVGTCLGAASWWIWKNSITQSTTPTTPVTHPTILKPPEKPPTPPSPKSTSVFDSTVAEWKIKNAPFDLTLHDLFLTDFDSVQQKASGAIFVDKPQKISVQYTISTELALRSKFLIFYIPINEHTAEICAYLAKQYNFVLDKAPQLQIEQKGVGDSGTISTKEAIFIKRIYVYHETYLDGGTTAKLTKSYAQEGISAIFRSIDYLSTKKLEARVRQQ